MTENILICTDLDRTLIPNGSQSESPHAREHFAALVARPEITLAYVSGRHRALVEQAINEYRLPLPDFVVGDVGATIYHVGPELEWRRQTDWEAEIAQGGFMGMNGNYSAGMLEGIAHYHPRTLAWMGFKTTDAQHSAGGVDSHPVDDRQCEKIGPTHDV